MTVGEVIARADTLRPNGLDEMEKMRYVAGLEERLMRELGMTPGLSEPPVCADSQLMADGGYEDIYIFYLCARIDLAHREYEGWNGMTLLFNALMEDFKKQKLRDKAPAKSEIKGIWRRNL